jgi:hypothetical protein
LFGAGQTNVEKTTCERNVYNCFENSKHLWNHVFLQNSAA